MMKEGMETHDARAHASPHARPSSPSPPHDEEADDGKDVSRMAP